MFFFIGLIGITFNNNNFLILLLRIEIMFLGLNMMFIGGSIYYISIDGLVFALLIFGIIAAESAIGLSLFFVSYLNYGTTEIDFSIKHKIKLN